LKSLLIRTLINCKCKWCNNYYYSTLLMFACDQLSEYHCSPENENFILALINQLDYNKYNNCYSFENDIIKRTAIIFSIACGHQDCFIVCINSSKIRFIIIIIHQ
jgi:hypothetical protein